MGAHEFCMLPQALAEPLVDFMLHPATRPFSERHGSAGALRARRQRRYERTRCHCALTNRRRRFAAGGRAASRPEAFEREGARTKALALRRAIPSPRAGFPYHLERAAPALHAASASLKRIWTMLDPHESALR